MSFLTLKHVKVTWGLLYHTNPSVLPSTKEESNKSRFFECSEPRKSATCFSDFTFDWTRLQDVDVVSVFWVDIISRSAIVSLRP